MIQEYPDVVGVAICGLPPCSSGYWNTETPSTDGMAVLQLRTCVL
jgi:hypothetical protein